MTSATTISSQPSGESMEWDDDFDKWLRENYASEPAGLHEALMKGAGIGFHNPCLEIYDPPNVEPCDLTQTKPREVIDVNPQVGQRIRMKGRPSENSGLSLLEGTIVHILESGNPPYGIEFDVSRGFMHDCRGMAKGSHGYFVPLYDFDVIENQLNDSKEAIQMNTQWLPETFTFAGQRVMINPESDKYQRTVRELGEDVSGNVLDHQASDRDLPIILKKGEQHIPNWSVVVLFDNGKRLTLRVKDLLQIENNFKNVTHYELRGYGSINVIEGYNEDKIDTLVIKEGDVIKQQYTRVYDEAFKKKHISDAYMALGQTPNLSLDGKLPF